jgi:hypothetical protein
MTNRFKLVIAAFCFILMASVIAPVSKAQNGDKKTIVTFDEPIEIPGNVILPAGTYFFKLLNQDSGRWVVQIFDEHQTKTFATLITIEDFRYHPTNKVVMNFTERPAGSPPAIKEWFFPGEKQGRAFVYGKKRAMELAKVENEPIPATTVEVAVDTPVVALVAAPVVAITPAGEEVPVATVVAAPAAVVETPAPAAVVVETPAPAAAVVTDLPLPHTASSTPLIALGGLLAIGAAFTLIAVTKRSA